MWKIPTYHARISVASATHQQQAFKNGFFCVWRAVLCMPGVKLNIILY